MTTFDEPNINSPLLSLNKCGTYMDATCKFPLSLLLAKISQWKVFHMEENDAGAQQRCGRLRRTAAACTTCSSNVHL